MNKRRIALFIILSVLLSSVATAAAAPLTDIENNPHRNAIEQMAELGILCGKGDGLFCPDDNLTRAEAAKVAMFLFGFDEQDATQAEALPQAFDDVYTGMGHHEWALGWINLAAREGIIEGYGDGRYGPGDNLTMVQWATILIRVLGYKTEGLDWPIGYDQLAHKLGVTVRLEYISDSHIKRDQMARLAANAVYDVERPDGSKIIDLLKSKAEDTPGDAEDHQLERIRMSVVLTPQVLPEGGGQTATIAVTVTDRAGNPVKGAKVVLHASAFEVHRIGDRNAQLSQSETTTDASGKAMATYTTLAADDKKMVEIDVSAFKDSAGEHRNYKIMAANRAAEIHGVVRDPYTGAPKEGIFIHFLSSETMESVGCVETDGQGRYRVPVPAGTYHVSFEMAIRDQITVNASSPGQTYTVDANKGILKGVMTGVSPGKKVMAFDWSNFSPNGSDNHTLQADIQSDGSFAIALTPGTYELFIVGSEFPSKTGITIKSGQVTDIGTVKGR